jgi:hypothetical protein
MSVSKAYIEGVCQAFIKALNEDQDLIDHPDLFSILDEVARKQDFMICAEQKGIYGTRIFFGRVSQYER